MASLSDKVILLTGASAGIGAETSAYLAQFKPYLVLTGRNQANLESVSRRCQAQGLAPEKILVVVADITKEQDMTTLVDQAIHRFGRIDVLINNAAIVAYNTVLKTSMEEYDRIMSTNIRGPFYLTKLCLPQLIKAKGNIVNISSISGQKAYTKEAAYGISKAALDQFTQILAMEMAEYGVRVNSVSPGEIRTDIQKKGGMSDEQCQYELIYVERQKSTHPLGHIGEPIGVAKTIAFLASDDASFITGQIMFVDGGRHSKPV